MASTSLIDLESSPDPLTDAAPSSVVPSSRRVTRSQTSQRFYALNSPRKQTFELNVGNETSPQRLRVTVEAEDFEQPSVKRRLFQSPTPNKRVMRRKEKATTTIVPLRGLTDDEYGAPSEAATPKRGRPRRSGTPRKPATPAAVRPRRPATPGGRFVRSNTVSSRDVLQSDTDAAQNRQTPRLGSNVKRVAKRKTMTPSRGDDIPSSLPRKRRGRPRKESTIPSGIAAMSEQESTADGEVEDNASVAPTEDNASVAGNRGGASGDLADLNDDIWLATLSDQATPVARRWHARDAPVPEYTEQDLPMLEPDRAPEAEPTPSQHSDADYSQPEEYIDFGGGVDSHSDAGSEPSENSPGPATAQDTAQDTVMTNEEFTMISIGSLPSMQPNSSMMAPAPQELGEATSLIIHRTLEELRQSQNRSAQQPAINEAAGAPSVTTESGETSLVQRAEDSLFPQPKSPQPWIMRSPRRNKATPLAKQVAVKNLLQADNINPPEPTPALDNQEAQDTTGYDDSFSQIPEAVLEAATPRRPRQPLPEVQDAEHRPAYIQPSIERPSIVNLSNPQTESNRLLTPDETPSIPSDDDEGEKSQPSAIENPAPAPAPAPIPELRSSPPDASPSPDQRRNESFSRHSRTRSTETPTEKQASFRSPALAALNGQHIDLAPPEPQRRPTLSPIVRAGRALQFITSDPPSPPNRDSVLRSPFRGSVAKSSPPAELPVATRATKSPPQIQNEESAARPAGRSWLSPFTHIKDLVVQGAQALSPRPALASGIEDPFGPVANASPRPSSARSIFQLRSEKPQVTQAELEDVKAPSPDRAAFSPGGEVEDEMSWQAETPSTPSSQDRPGSADSSIHAAPGTSPSNRAHAAMQNRYEQRILAEPENVEEMGETGEIEDSQPDLDQYQRTTSDVGSEPESEPESEPQQADQYDGEGFEQENEQDYHAEEECGNGMEMELDQQPEPEPEPEPEPHQTRGQIQIQGQEQEEEEEEEEEEEDIWAIEAQRPTPYTSKHTAPPRETNGLPPRRSKLPSPWRKNSRRLVYSDELQQFSAENAAPQRSEADEFSMLSQQNSQPTPAAPSNPTPHAARASKPDLSAFFSSPAVLPDVTQPGFGLFKSLDGKQSVRKQAPQPAPLRQQIRSTFQQPPRSFGNSLFPHLPQEEPEARPQARAQKLPSIPQKEFHIDRVNRENSILSSPAREASREATVSEPAQSSSPATPKRLAFAVVPQKMNFTPRSRNVENTLFNPKVPVQAPAGSDSLFSSAKKRVSAFFSSTGPAAAVTAARDDEDDYDEDIEDDEDEDDRDDDESRETSPDLSLEIPPKLNPVPNRAMSPAKSSFRSPMKPKTPGRVVEFTSSTLSPLAQAQARAERRASASPEKEEAGPVPPSRPPLMHFSESPSSTSSNGNRSPTRGPLNSLNAKANEQDKENRWGEEEENVQQEERVQPPPPRQQPPSFNSRSYLLNSSKPGPSFQSLPKPPAARSYAVVTTRQLQLPTPKPSSSTASTSSHASNANGNANTNLINPNNSPKNAHSPKNTTNLNGKPKPKQHLSQSQWTRDHWLRLDELLQARRKGMLQFQLTLRQGPTGAAIKTGAIKSHRLLGKQVTTASATGHGEQESMILEAWHLDIVEAFRWEVLAGTTGETGSQNGRRFIKNSLWTDEVLAKRLFALMVGEERRRAGRVDRAARAKRERERQQQQQQQRQLEEEVGWH